MYDNFMSEHSGGGGVSLSLEHNTVMNNGLSSLPLIGGLCEGAASRLILCLANSWQGLNIGMKLLCALHVKAILLVAWLFRHSKNTWIQSAVLT